MDVGNWRRRAGTVIDVGELPSFSMRGRGNLVTRIVLILLSIAVLISTTTRSMPTRWLWSGFGSTSARRTPGAPQDPLIETVTVVPCSGSSSGVRLRHGSSRRPVQYSRTRTRWPSR